MDEVVLDAPALIAFLRDEPGSTAVEAHLPGAAMSSVNLAEVGDHYMRFGASRDQITTMLRELDLSIVAPDLDLAIEVSLLHPPTRSVGLSLGDRFCLALARQLDRPALTTDRAWKGVADAVGVRVELIR